ncbi:MAG: pilus assembly protein PilP [Deltaproteobacteria bacterium]|nr:pilus assembly protein PilP [Deltaproteobacteria bacterium]
MKSGKKRFLDLIVPVLTFLLFSCKGEKTEEPPASVQAEKPSVSPNEAQPKGKEPNAPPPVIAAKRNPFLSYLALEGKKEEKIKTPLECCDLSVFKVMAVLSGADSPMALLQSPDGKTYTAKKGDRIGLKNGRIMSVSGRSIIVEETETDEEGRVISRPRMELSLPSEDEKEKAAR